jgi:hypothetical protein
MTASTQTDEAACGGLDWADRQPAGCRPPAGCDTRACSGLPPRPERMAPWALGRPPRVEGRSSAVGLEWRKGPRVGALQPYDGLVRFAVPPATRAKSRAAFCRSPAQDDPTAAALARARLRPPRDTLTARPPPSAALRAWQRLLAQHRALVAARVRRTPRRTAARTQYCPQALEWFKAKAPVVVWDCLPRWPPRKPTQRARPARLRAFCPAPNGRSPHLIAARLQAIRPATPLPSEAGVIAPDRRRVAVRVQP